jgi:hypothetical protein
MQLEEVKGTDLSVTEADVRQAEREANEALELLAELERAAVEAPPGGRPEAAELVERRALAEFSRRRVSHTRVKAERARAARRLLSLREVGAEVDKLAEERSAPDDRITETCRKIALASGVLRELCAGYDQQVNELITRAAALAAEEPSALGPKVSSAFVSRLLGRRGPDGVQHGRTQVRLIGEKRAAEAAALAAAGDADRAAALIAGVHQQPEPARASRYYRAAGGHIIAESGPQTAAFAEQERDGRLVRLTQDQTDRYLRGTLDDGN